MKQITDIIGDYRLSDLKIAHAQNQLTIDVTEGKAVGILFHDVIVASEYVNAADYNVVNKQGQTIFYIATRSSGDDEPIIEHFFQFAFFAQTRYLIDANQSGIYFTAHYYEVYKVYDL